MSICYIWGYDIIYNPNWEKFQSKRWYYEHFARPTGIKLGLSQTDLNSYLDFMLIYGHLICYIILFVFYRPCCFLLLLYSNTGTANIPFCSFISKIWLLFFKIYFRPTISSFSAEVLIGIPHTIYIIGESLTFLNC